VFRYVAFAWNTSNHTAAGRVASLSQRLLLSKAGWSNVFNHNGLSVFCVGAGVADCCLLRNQSGVIAGRLFRRKDDGTDETHPKVTSLSDEESAKIIRTGGGRLVDSYWGSYVAFLRNPISSEARVLRAPMGLLPCFRASCGDVELFFSRMEDCLALGLAFSLNWEYIAVHVALRAVSSRATALNDVTELKAGECAVLKHGCTSIQLLWDPAKIATSTTIDEPHAAALSMCNSAVACTRSWASNHERILLELSGGLDSSIVAGCLYDAPTRPEITAINCYYTNGSNGDERYYARLSAQHAMFELMEIPRPEDLRLEDALRASRTAVMYSFFMRLSHAQMMEVPIRSKAATAIFSGNGGDELFYRAPVLPAAVDFVRSRGLHPALLGVALSIARLQRVSLWRVLGHIASDLRTRHRKSPADDLASAIISASENGVVNADAIRSLAQLDLLVHPWASSISHLPPGKLVQILGISSRSCDHPFAHADTPEFVDPIMSQPLAEVCLRIPSYVHLHGGWDRAIARLAFANRVPRRILERTTKGGVEELGKEVLMRNLPFARDILLNGALVGERILKREKLEEALSVRPSKSTVEIGDIMLWISAEIWFKLWERPQIQAVA